MRYGRGRNVSAQDGTKQMTFEDERTNGRTQSERISHLAQWLEVTLGPRLTAFAVGVSQTQLGRVAHGEGEPGPDAERRIRNVYEATWFMAVNDGPGTAHDWLTQPNPELDDRAPAELLREGHAPAPVWFATSPTF